MNDPSAQTPSGSFGSRPRRLLRKWLLGLIGLLAAALLAIGLAERLGRGNKDAPPGSDPFPVLPISASPYRNTGPDARYVGSESCRACHADHDASFRQTGMGRSMATVDPAREPPDGAFDHPTSRRRYQVRRKDGQLWHHELLLTPDKEEVVLSEYPVKYVVGSGRHSLTYLVETDEFLVESPVTWYSSRKAWGMSPGYDRPHHAGFERAVGESCLICHAGHAEAVEGSLHRMRLDEPAISCERCHGPGSLHVERHAPRKEGPEPGAAGRDDTIVNPSRLPRDLAEAVCQQCHLQSNALVALRGRKLAEFRPGLPLQDFRADYRLAGPQGAMTVVGHVEQMHQSRCYQATDSLSCLTCHSPHQEPRPEERVAYYRAVCVSCHQPERCTVSAQRRQQESPDNNCLQCHMPTSPTEIPHLAFTHHRIGVHDKKAALSAGHSLEDPGLGVLEPFLDLPRLSQADRLRSLGMGYVEVASRARDEAVQRHYQGQALNLLSEAHAQGLRDPALDVALGRVRFALGLDDVLPYAERALAHPDLNGRDRCDALFLVAEAQTRQRRHADAAATLRQLNGLRRHALQWLLLADCERALGHSAASEAALQTAVRISPRLWQIHQQLAEHYRRQGDLDRAGWHHARAVP